VNFGEYSHLPIQNDDGSGVFLERGRGALDEFLPGDFVVATGVVTHRTGLPVLAVDTIVKQGRRSVPQPRVIQLAEATQFENLGRYVTFEAFSIAAGQNSGGDMLVIGGDSGSTVTVFYPRFKRWSGPGLRHYNAGDKLRITGLTSQYCPVEPYDRGYQIVIDDPSQVVLLERGWMIPPSRILYLLILLVFAFGIWWMREHRMADQRRTIRSMMALSEEVLSSNSVREISRKVQAALPELLGACNVEVYLFNRMRNTLDRIPNELTSEPVPISVDQPKGAFAAAVALCFRNRALLNVPDFRKSPMVDSRHDADLPESAVFVPMFAQGEALGVVAVHFRVRTHAIRNQYAALQHVANQIAASLKLQEQQSIREQLLRSEKMAAAGQLISAVAHDLRAPLNAIRERADRLSKQTGGSDESSIAYEAERGLQIVNHLLSFARIERSEARAVNLHEVVNGVIEAREPEWRRKVLRLENNIPVTPVEVFADESELEQVMLSLLIHVEHAVQDRTGEAVRVNSRVLGSRVQITIDFSNSAQLPIASEESTSGDSFGLRVCQAIAQSHGGDIRFFETSPTGYRYEFELPVYHAPLPTDTAIAPSRNASRVLTAILIEPDAAEQRRLLALLSARGHRIVPADGAEEAADLAQRMPFDAIFCSVRLPGLSWIEFFKRVRRRVSGFILLTESTDSDTGGLLKDGGGFVLRKPLEESELDSVLAEIETRHGANR
jgi:signal transduction histidine kinase